MSRPGGDGGEDISLSDGDRLRFLEILGDVWERFNWTIHAHCQVTIHYHLVVETPDASLSRRMRQLNGVYTRAFNRTHTRAGHAGGTFVTTPQDRKSEA